MKEAMWGLGLIMLCLLAFVIIGVVSNVTLTNQQDYYGVKQTSEASAYDSSGLNNPVAYRRGICVCANEGTSKDANGTYVINKRTQYTITEPDDNNECVSKERCELRLGEYVIDPKLFNENIIVRLGSIIKASEVYDIKVQEIIPYPPKISVYISYHQALNVEGEDTINSEIPNKFDGIFEDTGTQSVLQYKENTLTDWPLNCGTPETKTYCYYDKDGNVSSNKWRFCPELTDESKCTAAGYEAKIQVSDSSKCKDVCVCKNGQSCVMAADVDWGGGWTVESNDKCKTPEPTPQQQSSGGNCKWYYHYNNPHMCKDDKGGTIMKYTSGDSGFTYTSSDKAMADCKIAACGSAQKYASGCTALKGYDYKINKDSNKLHRNESSANWCSGKGYYYCSCVNRKS